MCKIFRDKQIVGRKIFQLEPRHSYKAPGGGKSSGWQNIQNLVRPAMFGACLGEGPDLILMIYTLLTQKKVTRRL